MADDLSLLFKLRADNAQAKGVFADTRADAKATANQLRQAFGPELSRTAALSNKAFAEISDNLTSFVGQRVPVFGNAFARVTTNVKGLNDELKKGGPNTAALAKQIDAISKSSGKSKEEITRFLTSFVRLETQAAKNEAAFKVFGGSVDLVGNKTAKFVPELDQAGASLAAAATETEGLGAAMAGLAGPIAIAIAGFAAEVLIVISLTKEIYHLAQASAEYQGKLYDLSQQTGVSVETLSALEVVARTTGGSIEALTQSLGIFQRHIEEVAEDPDSKASKAFKQLGIDALNTEEALSQALAGLAKMPEGFRQTALALEIFGRGGKAFLAIAKEADGDIGKIKERLKDLGLVTTEQAKLADEFNDQLVLLDVQLRGLGTKTIPVVLDVVKDLSETLARNRDVFVFLQGFVKGLAIPIGFTLRTGIQLITFELAKQLDVLKKIKEVVEFIIQHPIPGFSTPATPAQPAATPQESPEDKFRKEQQGRLTALKSIQNVNDFELAEKQRQANAAIAQAQRDFDAGKKSREELLDATLAGIKKQTQAEIDGLTSQRRIKLEELALAKDDAKKQAQITTELFNLDTQIADKRAQLRERETSERAKFRQQEVADEIAHRERLLTESKRLDEIKITGIQQQVALRTKTALDGDKEIENIEQTAIDREQNLLVKRLDIAGKDAAKSKEITDRIAALDQDRTTTAQRHSQQRLEIAQREADITLQLIQVVADAQIASIQAQAGRSLTEEQAAKRIAKIRLDALDAEISLLKARNGDTRVLEAQRAALQAETERDIEAGRQRDLENERRYADQLKEIKERVRDLERDAAKEIIRLMRSHFASRRDIIRAQTQLDLEDENERHRQAEERIRDLERENRESKRTAAEKLEVEKELNRLREAEAERHRLVMQGIGDQGKKDEKEASPFGRLAIDATGLKDFGSLIAHSVVSPLEALKGVFREVQDAAREFAAETEDSIKPLGDILGDTFLQVADAIGQTVQNWVLLGETGPAVMRKILAQALASIAAEAAVNAIKELALGFATLFFNPAESAAHFTAAGLWAAIGGASAIAGRSVAGDLFKSKSAATGGSAGGGSGASGELNPLNLARNAGPGSTRQIAPQIQPLRIQISVNDSKFGKAISAHIVEDFNNAGPIRAVIAGDGNLNRG